MTDDPEREREISGRANSILSALPVAGAFTLVAPIAVAGGLALAPLLAVGGLLAAPFAGVWRGVKAAWPVLLLLVGFVAFAAASALWSPYQPSGLDSQQGLKLTFGAAAAAVFCAGAGASPRGRALVRAGSVAAVIVLLLLLGVEALGDMPLNRMAQPLAETGVLERNPGRGVAILVIFAFAAIGALVGGSTLDKLLWRVVLVGTAALSTQFNMAGNIVAFSVGLVAFIFAWSAPRLAVSLLGLGLAAWVVAAPFILGWLATQETLAQSLPLSWQMRLDIWGYVAPRIAEAPWIGHGIDASRTITAVGQMGDLTFPQVPLHPHSAPLQVWYELGAVGAGLLAALLAAGGLMAGQALATQAGAAAAACGAVAALAVLWSISYGAWQEWVLAVCGIALALANAARR
jgi:O-antigen ligase